MVVARKFVWMEMWWEAVWALRPLKPGELLLVFEGAKIQQEELPRRCYTAGGGSPIQSSW